MAREARRSKNQDEAPHDQWEGSTAPVEASAQSGEFSGDPEPVLRQAEQPVVDPEPLVDPLGAPQAPAGTFGVKRVQILANNASVAAGGAHYSLRAGERMELPQIVADDLITAGLAQEV